MGEPVHPARPLAVPVGLGDGFPSGTRMGLQRRARWSIAGRIAGHDRPAGGAHRLAREAGRRGARLMELLLLSIYGSICWVVFKVFKIPLKKWSLPTAVLGGLILMFMILLVMNYNHPFTKEARIYFYTTPIVPVVRGPVIEVPIQGNEPLKKGDVLFRIDPRPYEYALQQKRAALDESEHAVKQLAAAAEGAQAKANEEIAARDRARQSFQRYQPCTHTAPPACRPLPLPAPHLLNHPS